MKREHIYLVLAMTGAIAPWFGFAQFLSSSGAGDFFAALFTNGASAGFTIDLVISSVVFWVFVFERSVRERLDHPWIYVVVNLVIGLSCALPLALWKLERTRSGASSSSVSRSIPAALMIVIAIGGTTPLFAAADPAAVIDRFFTAYRSGDVDEMLQIYAEDAVFVDVAQRHEIRGTDELRAFLSQLVELHASMDVHVGRRMISNDQVVVEYAYTGTLSGEALHERTGNPSCRTTSYWIRVTSWFDIKDGRIVRQTDYIDLAELSEVRSRASGATP